MTMHFRGHDLDALSREPLDEERIHALWRGTDMRVAARARRVRDRRLALGIAALALLGAALAWRLVPSDEPPPPSFLALAEGGVPGAVDAETDPARVRLADGTRVVVSPGARWVPTHNRADLFESQIEHGRVSFDIPPGGPRRWSIRVGQTTVEVLGTRFVVEHEPARTTVRVSRGRVAVHDARLRPQRVVLTAGMSVTIESEAPREAPVEPTRADAVDTSPPTRRRTVRWQGLAARGDHRDAYEALGTRGLRDAVRDADGERLMLLADVARLSGHPAEAVAPLTRLAREMPSDPRAPVAAVLLGRIFMDDLHQPARARAALERALELGVPAPLRPDVERRLAQLAPDDR